MLMVLFQSFHHRSKQHELRNMFENHHQRGPGLCSRFLWENRFVQRLAQTPFTMVYHIISSIETTTFLRSIIPSQYLSQQMATSKISCVEHVETLDLTLNRQFDVEFTPFTPHLPSIYPAFVDHFPRESHRIFTARSGTSTIELGCLGCRAGPGREGVRLEVTRPGKHRKNDGKSPCYENG